MPELTRFNSGQHADDLLEAQTRGILSWPLWKAEMGWQWATARAPAVPERLCGGGVPGRTQGTKTLAATRPVQKQ